MNFPLCSRTLLGVVTALLAITCTGSAQLRQSAVRPITSEVQFGGTYHLYTGTWTRGLQSAALAGPEIIYDNTCTAGLYFGLNNGDVVLDSGRIPSTNSPSYGTDLVGLYDAYEVNGFSIGYCTNVPIQTNMDIGFVDCYSACDSNALPVPLTTINLVNAPAGSATGSLGCWVINVDLANTTSPFILYGDCDGLYQNTGSLDHFGWTWTETVPNLTGNSGPMIAGDRYGIFTTGCGTGTTFPGATPGPGSGMGIWDQYQLGGASSSPGCYWFGGTSLTNPFASFYLKLRGDEGQVAPPSDPFCFGDGSGITCPCFGFGLPGEGCANTTGTGALLTASGLASFTQDTFAFNVSGVPGAKPGLLIRGNNAIALPAGDGILCTSGASQRSQVQVTTGGTTDFTQWNGNPIGSVANVSGPTLFQFWYRDPANPCLAGGFNFTNGWTVSYWP